MTLYVVATHLGRVDDLSLRAQSVLRSVQVVVGEEHKEASRLLKALSALPKEILCLNEHSRGAEHIDWLLKEIGDRDVALITDAGTPGFCDPGADLVRACHQRGLKVICVPGACSLSAFLSVSGLRLDQFSFVGFLPAQQDLRVTKLRDALEGPYWSVLMDTPYRLAKLLKELGDHAPSREIVIALNLTHEDERVLCGTALSVAKQLGDTKAQFILAIEGRRSAANQPPSHQRRGGLGIKKYRSKPG